MPQATPMGPWDQEGREETVKRPPVSPQPAWHTESASGLRGEQGSLLPQSPGELGTGLCTGPQAIALHTGLRVWVSSLPPGVRIEMVLRSLSLAELPVGECGYRRMAILGGRGEG